MSPAEIQRLLKEAIQAARNGEQARGRDLFLQVIAADERNEPAWLWLSTVVDEPADQLMALENVLTLNPANATAQAKAKTLRQQLGREVAPAPKPAPATSLPPQAGDEASPPTGAHYTSQLDQWQKVAAPVEAFDNDPYQCVYCGKLTIESDENCPHCGRSLLIAGEWESKDAQRLLVFLGALSLQGTVLLELPGPLLALGMALNLIDASFPNAFGKLLPTVNSVLGNFPEWAVSQVAMLVCTIAIGRVILWGTWFLMLSTDMEAAYPTAVGLALLDLAWSAAGYFWLGYIGAPGAILNGVFGILILIIAANVVSGRSQSRQRQKVVIDHGAYGHMDMYHRGLRYGRQGKWALAALHWQKATVLKPTLAQYYKSLYLAQTKLGRLPQALSTLETGAEQVPDDPEFKKLIAAQQQGRRIKAEG